MNTFSSIMALRGGVVEINSIGNIGTPGSLGTGSGDSRIQIGNGSGGGTVRYVGSGDSSTNRPIDMYGSTGGVTLEAAGSGAITYTAFYTPVTGNGSKTLTLTGTSTAANTFAGVIVDSSATGTTSVTKSGAGRWVLSGSSTYTGQFRLDDGTLVATANAPNSGAGVFGGTSSGSIPIIGSSTVTTGTAALLLSAGAFVNRELSVAAPSGSQAVLLGGADASGTAEFRSDMNLRVGRNLILAAAGSGATVGTVKFSNTWSGTDGVSTGTSSVTIGTAASQGVVALNSTLATSGSVTVAFGTLRLEGGDNRLPSSIPMVTVGSADGSGRLLIDAGVSQALANLAFTGSNSRVSGGTLRLANAGNAANVSVSGTGHEIASAVFLDDASTFTVGSNAGLLVSSVIDTGSAGAKTLTKTGAGTLTLGAANTYSGATTIAGGTIRAGNATALSTGAVAVNAGGLDLNGQALSIGTLSGSAATSILSSVSGSASLITTVTGVSTYAGVISDGAGTVGLRKTGAGTLTLTAGQTYTGNTIISGGTLALGSGASIASASVQAGAALNDGGTLDVSALAGGLVVGTTQKLGGYGTVRGDVVIANGAVVAPGGSIGTLATSGSVTFGTAGHYLFEITNANGSAGTGWDLYNVGSLGITASEIGTFIIDLQTLANAADQTAGAMSGANWDPDGSYQWRFLTATNTTFSAANFNASWFQVNDANFLNVPFPGSFSVAYGGAGGLGGTTDSNSLYIVYAAAVPEPGTLALAGIGAAGAAWALRRRKAAARRGR